jgi:hypothetical protein
MYCNFISETESNYFGSIFSTFTMILSTFSRACILLYTLLVAVIYTSVGQTPGTVLVISDMDARIILDGEEIGKALASQPAKFSVSTGEHYLQALADQNGQKSEKGEVIQIEAGKQKVLKFTLAPSTPALLVSNPSSSAASPAAVADLSFTITGALAVGNWVNQNPGKTYPDYPIYYYAFEKGDEIVIDFTMANAKGTNMLYVHTYPGGSEKYSNQAFSELKNVRIKVEERSIYRFALATNHAFDRSCKMSIRRVPASEQTRNFNPTVKYQTVYTTKVIQPLQQNFINGGNKATFGDGDSRVVIPVILPPNTVEWFYTFSAYRSKEEMQATAQKMQLGKELTKLVANYAVPGSGVYVGIAVNQLTQPPGADYCNIYLLDQTNAQLFNSKAEFRQYPEGLRENYKSGVVKITSYKKGTFYLGLKNPSSFYGINTAVEIAAITAEDGWVMEQK